ncbi:hypothetical protein WN944_010630 [Citrus x changshan-huyou]|uniref:Uncharacterized protein n=1 Tax=Citrus x changshan-huyou TaxID=2935761 RepID=A0AAP0MWR6_9ROSI
MEEVIKGYQNWSQKLLFVRGSQVLGIIPRALKSLGSLSDSPTEEELVILELDPRTFVLESPNNDGDSSRS